MCLDNISTAASVSVSSVLDRGTLFALLSLERRTVAEQILLPCLETVSRQDSIAKAFLLLAKALPKELHRDAKKD